MKKVLLIYPRLADSIEEKALLPLSLLYISALLKDVNDDDFLGLMEEVNVQTIFVGVESGSEDILKRLKKDITIEQVFISSEKLKNTNIKPTYSFMIGYPFETEDDRRKTLRLIYLLKKQKRSAIFGVNIFNPYPSNIMKECIDKK